MNLDLSHLRNLVENKTAQANAIVNMACDQYDRPHEKRLPDPVMVNALWAIESLLDDIKKAVCDFKQADTD
jgi:hypothetical protein